MTSTPNSNQTAASTCFIDLATFSEIEGFLYGGPCAITWFVRAVQKSNWFSHIPIQLRSQGTFDFNQKNAFSTVNRSGDYVLNAWYRVQIPQVTLDPSKAYYTGAKVQWCRYLLHNLIDDCSITFNELTVMDFDSYWLDFNFQFRLPAEKQIGYRNMVGDIPPMTTPVGPGVPLGTGGYFSLPLPFPFFEDSGIALPVAALPFNDIKINYTFRRLQDVIIVYPGMGGAGPTSATYQNVIVFGGVTGQTPTMLDAQTFSHYAVVHNDERVKMGDAPRDMLIYQVQSVQRTPFTVSSSQITTSTFDIRFSQPIVSFFFAAKNTSLFQQGIGEQSNYTTTPQAVAFGVYAAADPIAFATLTYESTIRVAEGADYFSLTVPYYWSDAIPVDTGLHMYSYAIHPWILDPSGSTNYSKLANVSVQYNPSNAALLASQSPTPVDLNGIPIVIPTSTGGSTAFPQKWNHVFVARNWNIVRVANGSLGFPVL
jgi:hypothetical protein